MKTLRLTTVEQRVIREALKSHIDALKQFIRDAEEDGDDVPGPISDLDEAQEILARLS